MNADRWEHADAVHRALLHSIDLDGPPGVDPAGETHDVLVQGALALVSIALELRALREGAEQPTGLLYDLAHRRGDRP